MGRESQHGTREMLASLRKIKAELKIILVSCTTHLPVYLYFDIPQPHSYVADEYNFEFRVWLCTVI